jgi:hypothetical protein
LAAGGAIATTITYYATTPATERNISDALLVAGAGAVGDALIGTGIGVAAGAVTLGATVTSGAAVAGGASILMGAGVGTVASAEAYMWSTSTSGDSFDRVDFAATISFGAAEGAISGHPTLGPIGRCFVSGISAGLESVTSDSLHSNRPVNGRQAVGKMGLGILAGVAGEGLSGGIGSSLSQFSQADEYVEAGAEFVDLTPAAIPQNTVLTRLHQSGVTRQVGRTSVRDLVYSSGLNFLQDYLANRAQEY